ncbi:MAG: lytic transglycosylase domain-containing protein [Gammaproteobacteria bacterium]
MIRTIIILMILFVSKGALADIFKVIKNGRVTYTNIRPMNDPYDLVRVSKHPRSSPASSNYRTGYFSGKKVALSAKKSKFADLINEKAFRYRVDPKLVHAVIQTESAYNATAVSSAGAVGLMQLMPDTARRYGVVDRRDPDQNIEGGTRYLKYLIEMFTPNLDLAVAAYNAGENAVIKHNYSIPPYPETRNYVKQVLSLYNRMSL